ncbi:MAG: hypothetical protein JO276_05425 [Sphingomonadaceae bacterium]|nr:hypothetical protein [Sphingomonadaceae bacterium]
MKSLLRIGLAALALPLLAPPAAADTISFTIRPDNGTARFISRRTFGACRLRNIDPWTEQCSGWRPVVGGQPLSLRGQFCIYGEWDDHRTHRGSFEMPTTSGDRNINYPVVPREAKGVCT